MTRVGSWVEGKQKNVGNVLSAFVGVDVGVEQGMERCEKCVGLSVHQT